MEVRLRRCVWVIDLVGMLVGARRWLGHLVAKQIVGAMSPRWTPVGISRAPRRGASDEGTAADAVCRCARKLHARSCSSVSPRPIGVHHYEMSRAFVDDHLLGRLADLPTPDTHRFRRRRR